MHIIQIELDIPLRRSEIPYLRGAIAERAGWDNDLFHNHREGRPDRYHYRYPLVQYQCRRGNAALVGLNAGAETLRALLQPAQMTFCGDLPVKHWNETSRPLGMTEQPQTYALRQWLALNAGNYRRWDAMRNDPEAQRLELERILVAHLLAFAEGVGYEVPRPRGLWVRLDEINLPRQVRCHDAKLLSFDVVFQANMSLPRGVGIGKAASHGFGLLTPVAVRQSYFADQEIPAEAMA